MARKTGTQKKRITPGPTGKATHDPVCESFDRLNKQYFSPQNFNTEYARDLEKVANSEISIPELVQKWEN